MLVEIALAIVALIVYLQYLYTKRRNYWKDKNVPFIPQENVLQVLWRMLQMQRHISAVDTENYYKLKDEPYGGSFEFQKPVVILRHPEVIKCIMVKDFSHFTDRRHMEIMDCDPIFKKFLTILKGKEWKNLRNALSPTFTTTRMKRLFYIMEDAGKEVVKYIQKMSLTDDVNMTNVMERMALYVVTSAAFGARSDVFEEKDSTFLEQAKKFQKISATAMIKMIFGLLFPSFGQFIRINFIDEEAHNFFRGFVDQALDSRVDSKKGDKHFRDDFLQLLIETSRGELNKEDEDEGYQMKNVKEATVQPDKDNVFAQSLLFLVAGFETISTVLTYATYELAMNPEIQTRLQREVDETNAKGAITYDRINELPYLNMVISETLRKYPPATRLERYCVQDYTIPDTNTVIEEGTLVVIPAYAIHMDPQNFPDPEKFDPERFSEEQKSAILPYTYMPFGHGPRNCIGIRFALMEAKVILAEVIHNFALMPCANTPSHVVFDARSQLLKGTVPNWLNVTARIPPNEE